MGLVLDSRVLVFAERQDLPVSTLLGNIQKQYGVTEIVLSTISVVELEHGIYRARSPQQRNTRSRYLKRFSRLFQRNRLRAESAIL